MGRPAGIGGIGLVIVLLVGIFFGVDLTPLLGPGGRGDDGQAPSGPNVVDDEQEGFVAVVLAETEDVWARSSSRRGCSTAEPRLVLFTGQTSSACGFAQSAMGPFYCPNDQTVYLDMDFFRVMEQQLGSRGRLRQGLRDRARGRPPRAGRAGPPRAGERLRARARASGSRTRCRSGSSCRPTAMPGSGRTPPPRALELTDEDIRERARHRGAHRRRRAAAGEPGPGGARQLHPRDERAAADLVLPRLRDRRRRAVRHLLAGRSEWRELVNLRTVRKQRARDAARREAARGDAASAEAERARAEAELERRRLEGHRRDEPED